MFEGSIPHPGPTGPAPIDGADSHALRELEWTDLVARLSAAHDYRASLQEVAASFDADSARWMVRHELQLHGEGGVNLEPSGKCKRPSATIAAAMHSSPCDARQATRGME